MNRPQSHEGCAHASNKAARAKCRRLRAKFNDAFDAMLAESALVPQPAVSLPKPIVLDDAAAVKELFDEVEASKPKSGDIVTRDNWQDVKGLRIEMEIATNGATGNSIRVGKITGWGEKKIRYVSDAGKLNMVDAEKMIAAHVAE